MATMRAASTPSRSPVRKPPVSAPRSTENPPATDAIDVWPLRFVARRGQILARRSELGQAPLNASLKGPCQQPFCRPLHGSDAERVHLVRVDPEGGDGRGGCLG